MLCVPNLPDNIKNEIAYSFTLKVLVDKYYKIEEDFTKEMDSINKEENYDDIKSELICSFSNLEYMSYDNIKRVYEAFKKSEPNFSFNLPNRIVIK